MELAPAMSEPKMPEKEEEDPAANIMENEQFNFSNTENDEKKLTSMLCTDSSWCSSDLEENKDSLENDIINLNLHLSEKQQRACCSKYCPRD